MDNLRWPVVVGGALIAIGSFLPWAQSGIFSVPGTSGDGIITLVFGVIILALAFAKRIGKVPGITIVLLGGLSGLIVLNVLVRMGGLEEAIEGIVAGAGAGLYVVGLGAIFAFASGFEVWKAKPQTTKAAPQIPEGK